MSHALTLPLPPFVADWLIARARRTPYYHLPGYMERYWLFGGSARDERGIYRRQRDGLVPEPLRGLSLPELEAFDRLDLGWRRTWLDRLIGQFVAARIHVILRSDLERDLHDHPWRSISLVLKGGYTEVMPADPQQNPRLDKCNTHLRRVWRGQGCLVSRRAKDRHRLEVNEPTVSLFLMLHKQQDWGFYTDLGWVDRRDYVEPKQPIPDDGDPGDEHQESPTISVGITRKAA